MICFCKSMKLVPLFANSRLRLIIESSLKLATARSACTSSYLQHREIRLQLHARGPTRRNDGYSFQNDKHLILCNFQNGQLCIIMVAYDQIYNCETMSAMQGHKVLGIATYIQNAEATVFLLGYIKYVNEYDEGNNKLTRDELQLKPRPSLYNCEQQ